MNMPNFIGDLYLSFSFQHDASTNPTSNALRNDFKRWNAVGLS